MVFNHRKLVRIHRAKQYMFWICLKMGDTMAYPMWLSRENDDEPVDSALPHFQTAPWLFPKIGTPKWRVSL